MNTVEVIFKNISEIAGVDDIGLLILTDMAGEQQIAVPCDKKQLDGFRLRLSQKPVAKSMLPEVLWQATRWFLGRPMEVVITGINEGQYEALLIAPDLGMQLPILAPEGIMLTLVSKGNVPVKVEEHLFRRQSTHYSKDSAALSLPINTITDKMLDAALQKAVQNENYEMAGHLRDEIKRRDELRKKEKDSTILDHEGD